MDAREFFLIHHEQVHSQRELLQGLSDEQMRLRPNGLNSVAWIVWHMARCEDALNVLVASRPQVLDQNDWLTRLNVSLRDVGTGMTDEEVSDLSARLDLGVMRDHYHAVGRRTVEMVKSLRPQDLNETPTCTNFALKVHSEKARCGPSRSGRDRPRVGGLAS
jgi:DinB superfamily